MTKAEQRSKMEQAMASFMAKGGTIEKVPARMKKKRKHIDQVVEEADMEEELDLSLLPTSLKIRFGIRDETTE